MQIDLASKNIDFVYKKKIIKKNSLIFQNLKKMKHLHAVIPRLKAAFPALKRIREPAGIPNLW